MSKSEHLGHLEHHEMAGYGIARHHEMSGTGISRLLATVALLGTLGLGITGCQTTGNVGTYSHERLNDVLASGAYMATNGTTEAIRIPCRFYVPSPYREGLPVVFFLHGSGQRGDDNEAQLNAGDAGRLVWYASNTRDAIVIIPQCPKDREWIDAGMLGALSEFVAYSVRVFKADRRRVYLAGFSMGGIGAWKLALQNPGVFAGIVPVCGGPLYGRTEATPNVPSDLRKARIWAFNNANDGVVQNSYAKGIIAALWDGGATENARFTEALYGHSDGYVFQSEAVLGWIFSGERTDGEGATGDAASGDATATVQATGKGTAQVTATDWETSDGDATDGSRGGGIWDGNETTATSGEKGGDE